MNFDQANEERVQNFLTDNRDQMRPHQFADLTRLDEDNYLIALFKTTGVLQMIGKFKNKAPGMSGINKLVLSKLPRKAVDTFTMLTNLAFSMGYYPFIFKNGLIVFPHKPGKDP